MKRKSGADTANVVFAWVMFIVLTALSVAEQTYASGEVKFTADFFIKLCIALTAGEFVLYLISLRYKRGKPGIAVKNAVTLPPENITASEVGYILNQYTDDKDIAAVFVQWMCDGSVFIEKGSGLNNTFLIKNKINSNAPRYQIMIYNEIFRKAGRLPLNLITSAYPGIVKDTKKRIAVKYEEKSNRVFSRPMQMLQDAVMIAGAFPMALLIGLGINESLNLSWLSALIAAGVFFLGYYLNTLYRNARLIKKAGNNIKTANFKNTIEKHYKNAIKKWILYALVFYAAICAVCAFNFNYIFLAFIGVLADLAAAGISPEFECYNGCGIKISSDLNSLKYYMSHTSAFREKADYRFKTEPDYFFRLLPYAYALDASNSWLTQIVYSPDKYPSSLGEYSGDKLNFNITFLELSAMFLKCLSLKPDKEAKI